MARPLNALERFMEEAVEGTVQKLFRPALQPVQLAKAAVRRMEEQLVIGPYGPEVPNRYTIALHPADFERFARFQAALQSELAKYLETYARDHGWRPVSTLSVSLEAEPSVSRGRPRVSAQMADSALAGRRTVASGDLPAIEATVVQRRAEVVRAKPPLAQGAAILLAESGEQFELRGPVVAIGRALENNVVIADSRVSRFHAEIRIDDGRYVARDLGSTNGTHVADEQIDRRELRDGDSLSIGGFLLTFRQTE